MLGDLQVDEHLLTAARGGEARAREALYDLVAPGVLKLVLRVVGQGAADDVFQQTLMHMFERLAAYRAEAPFGRWVRAIALNQCRMHLRSPWRRARVWLDVGVEALDGRDATMTGEFHPAASELDDAGRDLALDLQRLLRGLSPTARAVVWLHDVEGCTHEEIGAAFGRSEGFSKSQLARAHARLRQAVAAAPRPVRAPAPVPNRGSPRARPKVEPC